MATTFADLEARVRGLEARTMRTEEDITAIVTTVIETRDDVRWLKRAVQALLDQAGVELGPTMATTSSWPWSETLRGGCRAG